MTASPSSSASPLRREGDAFAADTTNLSSQTAIRPTDSSDEAAFFTPSAVHHGQVEQLAAIRNDALARAYTLHPERFVHGPPVTHLPPAAVYINPPEDIIKTKTKVH